MSTTTGLPQEDFQQKKLQAQKISPTLIIGLGGTGGDVLLRIRKKFFEKFGGIEEFPIVAYLWFDTDKNYKDVGAKQFAKKVDFANTEERLLTITDTRSITEHLDQPVYAHIASWWPTGVKNIPRLDDGAGQYRPYSRLGLFHHFTSTEVNVRESIQNALTRISGEDAARRVQHSKTLSRLNYAADVDFQKKHVYVIGSIAGGTGSGIFLDIARIVQSLDDRVTIVGFFMTSRFFPNAKPRMHANTYSALLEWDYYNDHEYRGQWSIREVPQRFAPPVFHSAYLLDTPNAANVTLGGQADDHKKMYETIAENVFKDFSQGAFANAKRSARVNLSQFIGKPWQYPPQPPEGVVLSSEEQEKLDRAFPQAFNRHYQSFGLASISVPHDRIITACAHKLAADLVDFWKGEGASNTVAINQDVDKLLPVAHLQGNALLQRLDDAGARGELASAAGTLLTATIRFAEKALNEMRQLPVLERADFIDRESQKFRTEQLAGGGRGQNPGEMVRVIRDNADRTLETTLKTIKNACDQRLDKEKQSILSTVKFAERIGEILENRLKEYTERAAELRELVAVREEEYNNRIHDLRTHAERHNLDFRKQTILEYDELRLSEAIVGTGTHPQEKDDCPGLLLVLRQLALYEQATEVCQKLLHATLGMKDNQGVFQGGLVSRFRELERTFGTVARTLRNDAAYFEDKHDEDLSLVLFETSDLDKKYYPKCFQEKPRESVLQELSDKVRDQLNLTAASVADTNFLKREGGSGAIVSLCREQCESIRDKHHIIDVLFDSFGAAAEKDGRPEISESLARELERVFHSAYYWALSGTSATQHFALEKGQVELHVGLPTVPLSLPPADRERLQRRRGTLQYFLKNQLNERFQVDDVPDTSEIIFYTDVSGVPLNFFASMREMRAVYRDLRSSDPSLHTESREASKFEDVLILTREEVERFRAAYSCFVRCAMFNEIWADGKAGERIEYGYTDREFEVEVHPRIGDARTAILHLQTRDDVLRKLDQRATQRLDEIRRALASKEEATLASARQAWAGIAAIVAVRMKELTASLRSSNWRDLAVYPKMEFLALGELNNGLHKQANWPSFKEEVAACEVALQGETASFATKRLDGRWTLRWSLARGAGSAA